ncbi:hypothetical protein DL96DRAFT_1629872 [Flagelloscypha sp. PMI_526]|nr:hypothetical protein DL96DRAFT_1629872 [Flagelloscypha sp. PMI_526]
MRTKQLWINLSFLPSLRLVWQRITVTRLTIGYFLFSVLHCVIQTGLQGRVFALNRNAAGQLSKILEVTNTRRTDAYPLLGYDMRLCSSDETLDACVTVWDGTPQVNFPLKDANATTIGQAQNSSSSSISSTQTVTQISSIQVASTASSSTIIRSSSTPSPAPSSPTPSTPAPAPPAPAPPKTPATPSAQDNDIDLDDLFDGPATFTSVDSGSETRDDDSGPNSDDDSRKLASREDGYFNVSLPDGQAMLTKACVQSLNYPVFALERTEREDAALVIFNFWVLGMSVVAILNESIPHVIASLLTHILSTAWSGFQLAHTAHFHLDFDYVVKNGACAGAPSLLPSYWQLRNQHEIPALALNCIALAISVGLTFYLIKTFGWKTYKRIGASLSINRMYKLLLVFSIGLQLALFFIAITVGVWVDQLFNGAAKSLANHRKVYETVGIITILFIGPWLWLGWTGARKEARHQMTAFLCLSILYIASWLLMLISHTFRWQFTDWPFFSVMVVLSLLLTMMTVILGLFVRLNFGKGLINYLNNGDELPNAHFINVNVTTTRDVESDGFRKSIDSDDGEKIVFPEDRPGLIQNSWELPLGLPPPAIQEKSVPLDSDVAPQNRKLSLPSHLKGVARYQGLVKSTNSSSTI